MAASAQERSRCPGVGAGLEGDVEGGAGGGRARPPRAQPPRRGCHRFRLARGWPRRTRGDRPGPRRGPPLRPPRDGARRSRRTAVAAATAWLSRLRSTWRPRRCASVGLGLMWGRVASGAVDGRMSQRSLSAATTVPDATEGARWTRPPAARSTWGTTSSTASRHSTAPLGDPGVLRMSVRPRVPATARDRRPRGDTRRMASARPGAWRSSTTSVPSGVRSRGPNPVPPVVTTRPANPSAISTSASPTDSRPSGTTRVSTTSKSAAPSRATSPAPPGSVRVPAATPSDTVSTLAWSAATSGRHVGSGHGVRLPTQPQHEHAVGAGGLGQHQQASAVGHAPTAPVRRRRARGRRGRDGSRSATGRRPASRPR